MEEKSFHEYLLSKGLLGSEADSRISFIRDVESRLQRQIPGCSLEDINGAYAQSIVDNMIDRSENSLKNMQTLLLYAQVIGNNALYLRVFQHLDGYEAFNNLYNRLALVVGEDFRDVIFEELTLPPLGLSPCEKSLYTYRVMSRLGEIFEEETVRALLKDSLRDLPETMYSENKRIYEIDCHHDIDCYLEKKGQRFIKILRHYREEKMLFFGQEINDNVIAYVEENKEIGQGIRQGNIIYETKIPYNTKFYLSETDAQMKPYHYCHCPWVRESIRKGEYQVDPIFCQCSAGFHKKPYEIIFGQPLKSDVLQSVLKGDDICRFAIYLPV